MKRLLALSTFYVFTIIQVASKRCCTVEQYETSFVGAVGYTVPKYLEVGNLRVFYQEGVDLKTRQVGRDIHVEQLPTLAKGQFQLFRFFDKHEQYVVKDGVCSKHELSQKVEPQRCVPEDAEFAGSSSLGDGEIIVDSWRKRNISKGLGGEFYGTWTHENCIPVLRSFGTVRLTDKGPVSFISDGNFMNFSEGIKSRDRWFKLPSSCQNTTLKSSDNSLGPLQKWILFEEGSALL